ncbi:MAG: VWA domain-containing protein [bacterium]|nr:VWA domain-containing protein [bacterium]
MLSDSARSRSQTRRGAMLILIAVCLVLLLVGAVFSVDMAYMFMVRAELQAATDAAARAGSEALARTQDPAVARAAAIAIAEQNTVAGDGLSLATEDVELGSVVRNASGRFDFLPNVSPLTAVRVHGRRESGSLDGPVGLFFAPIVKTYHFQPAEVATAAASVRDVALVLDISGSMGTALMADDGTASTRLAALKQAVNVFLDEIAVSSPATRVSLVSYSDAPTKRQDLTSDFELIRSTTNSFKSGGWTAIGNALSMGSDSLVKDANARSYAAKTVIVMTDGIHNTGPSPDETVATAIARGQQVHTITFSAEADQALMKTVAEATAGGIHIHADGAADLASAFREIARAMSVTLVD